MKAAAPAATIVFTITVDASGVVTLDQVRAVVHNDPLDPDEPALRRRRWRRIWSR